jgi:hypothetical protein
MSDSLTLNGSEDGSDAIRLKALGNEDFKNGHFDKAIKHYSRAIGSFNLTKCILISQKVQTLTNGL